MAHHTGRSSCLLAGTILSSTLGFAAVGGTAHAATLRVGSGLPHSTIQSAVSAAAPGDTIVVFPGTYRSTTGAALVQVPSHLSNLTIRALLPGTVTLRKGGLPLRNQRGIAWHAPGGTVRGIQFRNFRAFNGGAILATRSGLTVRKCDFHGNRAMNGGGAIHFNAGSPAGQWMLIEDCMFLDNDALREGGAVHAVHELDIRRSTFEGCDADRGGAISMVDARDFSWIESSEFKECTARESGGAISAKGTWLGLLDCGLSSNEAIVLGGAVWAGSGSDLTISASDLTGNIAGDFGGAISVEQSTVSIAKSSLIDNQASDGGALDLFYGEAFSSDTTWSGNSSGGRGGAIFAYLARLAMDGDLLANQSSGNAGGAMFIEQTAIEQRDLIYRDNTAAGGGEDGGAIFLLESTLEDAGGTYEGNAGYRGGAILSMDSDARFEEAGFEENFGLGGGAAAIHIDGSAATTSITPAMTAIDCDFIANESFDRGGALGGDNIFVASGCQFESNLAYNGGHVHLASVGSGSVFADCHFDDGGLMHAGGYGGALWAEDITGGLVLDGCTGSGNDSGWYGGAFRIDADAAGTGALLVADSILTNNIESVDGDGYFLGDGGQLHVSGRMMTLENSHLEGSARRGGAVAGLLEIDRCTLGGLSSEAAGAAWLTSGSTVTDSVLDGGTDGAIAAVSGGDLLRTTVLGVRSENDAGSPGYSTSGTTAAASVDHATDCWFGAGGQAFVAIIAGTDSGNVEDSNACRMDFDHDGDIDADDLAHLSAFVGTIEWGQREDLDDDGDVDADDVATITAAVGTSCS